MPQVEVVTPIPGLVASVNVQPGSVVKAGDPVAVLQAMKTEIQIESEHDGTVTRVWVSEGQEVEMGSVIATLDVR